MDFDPAALGLMVGLEIHQQLGERKLFCQCRAEIVEDEPSIIVKRQLRAAAGETGAIDIAAAAEQKKQKVFEYQARAGTSCLVELDEEPPHPVNEEVMTTAIMVGKALGSTILPKVQFMRKTIVDGSAVAGFQRTGLFALGGTIPETDVRIQAISVEEDSSKIIKKTASKDTYNLSRLGIPLLEISTMPDIKSPEQAKDVAAALGMVLRSTKRVKRGLGTIRQDLNISIRGGVRNEIKGCQDLKMIPKIVMYEAIRQQTLLQLRETLPAIEASKPIDVTDACKTGKGFIQKALAAGQKAIGVRLTGFHGILGRELCPGYRLGTELADLIKPRGFGGIIHSDEDMSKYGLDLKDVFCCQDNDAFLLVIGEEKKSQEVLTNVIIPRLQQMKETIPQEVRKANDDGTTSYLRPIPGAARMYPETDIPIVRVETRGVAQPKLLTEQTKELIQKYDISKDHAQALVKDGIDFEAYVQQHPKLEPTFIANALTQYGRDILSRYKKEIAITQHIDTLFTAAEEEKIPKDAIFELLVDIAHGKAPNYEKFQQLPEEELKTIIKNVVDKNPGKPAGALMGDIMQETRGKADGKRVMQLLQELL
ncbi:MAG: Glu-tRNA(Gln) amidotransferase subunit GatE [Candidatus Woesearchaeota archaeon]|nr:Glu-tRNA(Gln) amidotransferase subunit GatE [Candidatus Woesearchaeota archaeon]